MSPETYEQVLDSVGIESPNNVNVQHDIPRKLLTGWNHVLNDLTEFSKEKDSPDI